MAAWDGAHWKGAQGKRVIIGTLKGVFAVFFLSAVVTTIVWVATGGKNLREFAELQGYHPQKVDFVGPNAHRDIDCVAALDSYVSDKPIYFATSSARIAPADYPFILSVSAQLEDCENAEVYLIGHADGSGSDGLNSEISWRRAEAFLEVLAMHDEPIVRYRLFGQGARESLLVGDSGEEDEKINRRLELQVKYIDKSLR